MLGRGCISNHLLSYSKRCNPLQRNGFGSPQRKSSKS